MANIQSKSDSVNEEVKVQVYNFANSYTRAAQDGAGTNSLIQSAYGTKRTTNTLMEILRNEGIDDTIFILFLKASLGIPMSNHSSVDGTIFALRKSSIRPVLRKKIVKVKFKEYLGVEVVDFKNGETRGQMTHDGDIIIEIINFKPVDYYYYLL